MWPHTKFKEEVLQYLRSSICNKSAEEKFGILECEKKFECVLSMLSIPPMYTTLRLNCCEDEVNSHSECLRVYLEKHYAQKSKHCPSLIVHPQLADCCIVENYGPCHVLPVDKEIIVDASCGMSVLRGADIFVQGILAASASICQGDKVSVYVDTDGCCRKGLAKVYDGEKVFIGNGIAEVSRRDLFENGGRISSGVGVSMIEPLYVAPSLSGLDAVLFFPQNLPSIVCCHVLDPQPGDYILDMCAAPGGKTTHIATLMKNKGRVVAIDKSKNKVKKLSENITRRQMDIVEVYEFDSTKSFDVNAETTGSPPYPQSTFDRILLDAPCSGLGQRPLLVYNAGLSEATSYPPLQKRLFEKAVSLLKPGGTLVYSTCTITVDENESIVGWAVDKFPCLTLVSQTPHIGGEGWPCRELKDESLQLVQRFDPSVLSSALSQRTSSVNQFDLDTIGFFIAKFVKTDVT